MRFNRLDLNQLVVLDALLKERSVSRAAERVFLSQPAASCALGRLREYFGDDLLVQVGKSMVLTPAAEAMIVPVRDVLMQIHAITAIRPGLDLRTVSRKLKIEASDYVLNVLLADVLKRCAEVAPHLEFDLQLVGMYSSERLERGESELLIAPDFALSANHPSKLLFQDSFSVLVWAGNPDIGEQITKEQFFSMGHVAPEWGGGRLLSVEDELFARQGHHRRHEVVVPSFTLIPQFVVGTRRIATLQTRLAHKVALTGPLRVIPCPVEGPVVRETVQWHRSLERDPIISWFRGLIQDTASQLPLFEPQPEPASASGPGARMAATKG